MVGGDTPQWLEGDTLQWLGGDILQWLVSVRVTMVGVQSCSTGAARSYPYCWALTLLVDGCNG